VHVVFDSWVRREYLAPYFGQVPLCLFWLREMVIAVDLRWGVAFD
jgi:hypothetical protein